MSALDEILALDAQYAFASADMMFEVESVVYKVNGTTPRTLNVSVWRSNLEDLNGHPVPRLEIFVPRSSVSTIGITVVNDKRDLVTIATKKNGTPEDHPVIGIIGDSDDAGGFRLLLR